jgi:hypothetical protein
MRHTFWRSVGALPTATNRTVTLGVGNSPAARSADAASRGRLVRIMDDASVSGRSLSWNSESGIPAVAPASLGGLEKRGELDIFSVLGVRWLRRDVVCEVDEAESFEVGVAITGKHSCADFAVVAI